MFRYLIITGKNELITFDFIEDDLPDLYKKIDIKFWPQVNKAFETGFAHAEEYRFLGVDRI